MLYKSRELIKKICEKHSIEYKLLSKDWIIMLKKNNKIRFISGCKFSLNDHAIGEILDDKYALYDVLRANNIPVVEYNILYPRTNNNSYAIDANNSNNVKEYLKKHNEIVLKPCKGTCGNDVYHITDINEIDEKLDALFSRYSSISYSPYYNIKNEYRVITLNGNIEIIYKKERPIVIGNGKESIRELLLSFNYEYFKDKLDDSVYDKILAGGESYEYSWKFNLSNGSRASFDISNVIRRKIESISKSVIKKLDVKFSSIDIVEVGDNFLILEMNSGVMVENLLSMIDDINTVENVYERAILSMFGE